MGWKRTTGSTDGCSAISWRRHEFAHRCIPRNLLAGADGRGHFWLCGGRSCTRRGKRTHFPAIKSHHRKSPEGNADGWTLTGAGRFRDVGKSYLGALSARLLSGKVSSQRGAFRWLNRPSQRAGDSVVRRPDCFKIRISIVDLERPG